MNMVAKMSICGNEMYVANTEDLSYESLMGMQPVLKKLYSLENPKMGYWRYGKWDDNGYWVEGKGIENCRCSECQRSFPVDNQNNWYWCPQCGTKMVEKGIMSNENNSRNGRRTE